MSFTADSRISTTSIVRAQQCLCPYIHLPEKGCIIFSNCGLLAYLRNFITEHHHHCVAKTIRDLLEVRSQYHYVLTFISASLLPFNFLLFTCLCPGLWLHQLKALNWQGKP
ncbi:MAG: hypothetical protein RMX68_008330 [Aulosira sp. ZfuVER01]|nr:hypothetical protein [Aulosira sp. ZfuVER01]MDZ7997597.1 hypothetical protein [Aulosira sp. DedVER01a]MDZ8054599.1 hypothetical protein [Aulosira sp. ZfuCHP01]